MIKHALAISGLMLLVNCKTTHGKVMNTETAGATAGTAQWGFPFSPGAGVVCPEGQQLMTTGIKRLSGINVAEAGFQGDLYVEQQGMKVDENVSGVNVNSLNYVVRFDFCFDNAETLVLHQAIIQRKSEYSFGGLQPVFHVLKVKDPQPSPAFAKAMFEQDYSDVEAKFIGSSGDAPSYFIKGHKLASGASFLTISAFQEGADPFIVAPPSDSDSGKLAITVAELEPSNPFEAFDGPIDENEGYEFATHSLTQETLSFKFSYQVRVREGGYRTYRYNKQAQVQITDNNPKLASKVKITAEKDAVKDTFKYQHSHHNLDDVFTFADPNGQATYILKPFSEDDGFLEVRYKEGLGIEPFSIPIKRTREPIAP